MVTSASPVESSPRLSVGYVLKMFPRLSETFILHELLELERRQTDLAIFSLKHPADGRFHGRLSELRVAVEYVPSDRPENHWKLLRGLPDDEVVPLARWQEAVDFLRHHRIPKDLDMLLRAVRIASRVRRLGLTHLHAHFATSATQVCALVGMLTGVPYSFTCHAKDIFRRDVDRDLFRALVERSAFVITVSDFNRRFILDATPGVPEDRIHRLYNGIDLGFFEPNGHAAGGDVLRIVSVGRLVRKKGFHHLLGALKRCHDRGVRFRATIIGEGEERDRLLAQRDASGLHDHVEFTGALAQEAVREELARASMVALACVPDDDGNMDALPTVLLESLALDVPIVSTRLAGIPEIVGPDCGILTAPGDDDGLAEAIETVGSRVRAGSWVPGAGRERAEQLFDLRRNVETLQDMFRAGSPG